MIEDLIEYGYIVHPTIYRDLIDALHEHVNDWDNKWWYRWYYKLVWRVTDAYIQMIRDLLKRLEISECLESA